VHQKLQIEVITNLLDEVWPSKISPQESLLLIESVTNFLARTALNDHWDEQDCNTAEDIYVCRNIHLELLGMKLLEATHEELHKKLPFDNEGEPMLIERKVTA
jgi:hypothetical protein